MATPEEKKLAKKLAREEMLLQIRRDTLKREAALDKTTLTKIKEKWFETVVDTKVPQMQDNLKHILHYMEKLLEAEGFRKSQFEDERRELEEKTTLMAQSHSSAMEALFDIYEKRIQDLHNAYKQMVTFKKTQAEEEFSKIEERENETQENMQAMLFKMNQNRDEKEEVMNFEMFFKMDDERSKHTEIKENLRMKLEKNMEKRWGEITSTLIKYEENTKARRKDYMQLKIKDDHDSRIILQQMKKTQKLFEQLDELKRCMDECYAPKETITLIRDTREERAKFFHTFKKLKVIVDGELKGDEASLKILTVTTNSLLEDLKELRSRGEQILTLYRICLQLETEYEKVMPKTDPFKTKDKKAVEENAETPEKRDSFLQLGVSKNYSKDFEILAQFWKKVGSARLSKMALETCIRNISNENHVLKQMLCSYLEDVSNDSPSKFSFELS